MLIARWWVDHSRLGWTAELEINFHCGKPPRFVGCFNNQCYLPWLKQPFHYDWNSHLRKPQKPWEFPGNTKSLWEKATDALS